jgi:hypothetical protein
MEAQFPMNLAKSFNAAKDATLRAALLVFLSMASACSREPQVIDPLGPEPDARSLLSGKERMFKDPEPRVVAFSKPRPWKYSTFYAWRICFKATDGVGDRASATKVYVGFVQRNQVIDRREAAADDLCSREQFERFAPAPVQ